MLRRIIRNVLVMTMVIILINSVAPAPILAYSMSDVEIGRRVLLDSGWTNEEIDDLLTDDVIAKYADAVCMGIEKKFYKVEDEGVVEITEEECTKEVHDIAQRIFDRVDMVGNSSAAMPYVAVGEVDREDVTTSDGYLTSYVRAYHYGGGDYILQGRYEWLITPLNRKIDVFALRNGTGLVATTDEYYYYVYKADITVTFGYTSSYSYTYTTSSPDDIDNDERGMAVCQQLQRSFSDTSGNSTTAVSHRGYIEYTASKANEYELMSSVTAKYYHQQSVVQFTPSVSFSGVDVSVSPAIMFKHMGPNATISFPV